MTTGGSSDSVSRIREVFLRARELPEGVERDTYLEKACRDQPRMLSRVMRMLVRESTSRTFLEDSPGASSLLAGQVSLIGTVIDHYRIAERLGEGGFGEVFRVEQTEPVKRELALKIIKPGMDSREVIARFEGERQALALMDHPHIAQVYDAGTTETGRPYFVMELVRGKPITRFCESRQLTISERLVLFQKVCAAVQHAHQKGIIHRDLKPSNIVITTDEVSGEAIPKIIDFGIAKSLQGPLTDRTLVTQREVLLGTPAYMSPEQLELGSENLDTRTDIYALGILLYELLSGVQPFERKTLERAAFAEVQRIIREVEPPKPSDRVRTLGDSVVTLSGTETMVAPALERVLRGDLDWIVMKSIEKERERRYQGAGELVEDIKRYLENKPVEAGPPSQAYRLKKFVRRHRVGVAFSVALAVAVVTGFILVVIGFSRASHERDRAQLAEIVAEAGAVRAEAIQTLYEPYRWDRPNQQSGFLMLGSNEEPVATSHSLRISLSSLAARLDKNPPGLEAVERELRKTLADSYLALEMTAEAIDQLDRLIELNDEAYGTNDVRYADSLMDKATALDRGFDGLVDFSFGYSHRRGNPAWQVQEAHHLAMEALAIYRRHNHASSYVADAILVGGVEDVEECDTLWRDMLEFRKHQGGEDTALWAGSLLQFGLCLAYKGRFDEAEPIIQEAWGALRSQDDGPYSVIYDAAPTVGEIYRRANRPDEAERIYRAEITKLENKVRGEFNISYESALGRLDTLLEAQGRPDPEVKRKLARIALWRELNPALCRVEYAVRVNAPGTYRFYLRWDGFDGLSNSIAVRIRELRDGPGGVIADVYGFTVPGFPGDADFATINNWQDRASFEDSGHPRVEGVPVEWVIAEPGTYTIQLIGSETGAAVDAFVLQRACMPAPTESGPPRDRQNPDGSYTVVDGRIVVEAEAYSGRIPGRITDWLMVPGADEGVIGFENYTGDGYLQVLPESDAITPGELLRVRAQGAHLEGDDYRALDLCRKAVQLDPSARSYFQRGRAYERLGDYLCAIEDFQKAVELNPNDWTPFRHFWDCHLRVGNNDFVIDMIRPYVEVEGAWVRFIVEDLALARVQKGLWREAIAGIQPKGPGDRYWILRGDIYAQHNAYEEARQEYLTGARTGRGSIRPYSKLAALYLVDRDRVAYEACLENMPPVREDRMEQHRLYLWQSLLGPDTCPDREELKRTLARFLNRFDPKRVDDQLARAELAGGAFYRLGDYDRAVALLTEAQEIEAESRGNYRSRWMFFLAMARQGQGRSDEAREWFDRAEVFLAEERISVPAREDPAHPWPWENAETVELLREEAAAIIGVQTEPEHTAMPD